MAIIYVPDKPRMGKLRKRRQGNKARYRLTESGGGPASAFSPDQVAGLELWLEADAITGLVDNDPVATWSDSSGNGRDATQSNASLRPVYKTNIVNGLPVVRYTAASSHALTLPNFLTGFTAGEVFLVVKIVLDPPVNALFTGIWRLGNSGSNSHYPFTDGTVYDDFGSNARKTTVNPTPSLASAFRVYNVLSKSGEWTSRLDGSSIFTTGTNTVAWNTAPLIGNTDGSNITLNGDIAEVILYSQELSASNRSSLTSYLGSKYGLF